MQLDTIMQLLPHGWQEPVGQLRAGTLLSGEALKVCLVGAFSAGKSSLINMLVGEEILPYAEEETTALPTFVEYGEQMAMQLVNRNGEGVTITSEQFRQITVDAPEGASCTLLQLPQPWLRGLLLMDLPGLGGNSEAARSYTMAQIKLADVLLYLVPPRGPASEDLETLALVQNYGKRVKVVVSQWDLIEAAMAADQQAPDLFQWTYSIEQATGLKMVRLEGVSKFGHGKESLLDFLARTRDDVSLIRECRFKAELGPLIRNALGANRGEQEVCSARSEEGIQALHEQLLQRKRELVDLKASLYERQHRDQTRLEQSATLDLRRFRQMLASKFDTLRAPLSARFSQEQWGAFLKQAEHHSRGALAEAASALSSLSANYGTLDLPPGEIEALNLHLPVPEQVEVTDFLDLAQLKRLEAALIEQQERQDREREKCESLVLLPQEQVVQQDKEFAELHKSYFELQSKPLAKVIEEVEGGGVGRSMGRMVGEVADIALLFVNPVTVAAKTASIVGKGAKVVNFTVNTSKIAKNVNKGVRIAKAIRYGNNVSPLADKLGALEMLSLGYWGEKIGGMFDGESQRLEYTDPQALAEQQASLAEIRQRMEELTRQRNRLQDLEAERELSGLAQEQSRREQALITQRINALKERAEIQAQAAREETARRHDALQQQEIDKAVRQLLSGFDQQTQPMLDLLLLRCKQYWQGEVEQTILARASEVDSLTEQLRSAPIEKEANLALLRGEADKLRLALEMLTN